MGLLDGKVAVVTGAGAGLGRAYAQLLAREGAAVVVNDYAQEPAEEVVKSIREAGGTAVASVADVGSVEGGQSILQDALSAFGRVDILVNNAGILRDKSLVKMDEADWDAVVRVHLKGTYCVTRAVFGQMKEAGRGGVIVNTTSTSGLRGKFGQTNYGSAKAAIWGFSNSLAHEGLKYGIRVWTIAPAAASQLIDGMVSTSTRRSLRPSASLRCCCTWLAICLANRRARRFWLAVAMSARSGWRSVRGSFRRNSSTPMPWPPPSQRAKSCCRNGISTSSMPTGRRKRATEGDMHPCAIQYPAVLALKEEGRHFSWTERDTMLYGLAIGMGADPLDRRELPFVYEEGLRSVPTFAAIAAWGAGITPERIGVDRGKTLHGEEALIVHQPIPVTGSVIADSRVLAVYDKGEGKGAVIQRETVLRDPDSKEPLATLTRTAFARADGGFGGPPDTRARW